MMIEFAVCMSPLQAKVGAKPGNERKSNNGVTNEIGVREVRPETRDAMRGFHLHVRVHVLPGVHGRDEGSLPELRRGIREAAAAEMYRRSMTAEDRNDGCR